jgi:transcriptional regulator with XRE-family HTH domain
MKYPNLAWALRSKGLRQYQVARAIGMAPSAFSRGLAGYGPFSTDQRCALAKLLGMSSAWLFREIAPPRRRRPSPTQARSEV